MSYRYLENYKLYLYYHHEMPWNKVFKYFFEKQILIDDKSCDKIAFDSKDIKTFLAFCYDFWYFFTISKVCEIIDHSGINGEFYEIQ